MKTYKGLYGRVCSFGNLHMAFRKASRGKGGMLPCAEFSYAREGMLLRLQEQLLAGTWRHGPYKDFTVRDPKTREVRAAEFPDRVVHHALCNVIEPIFEARFIPDSFACRKGKGTLAALKRCEKFVRRHAGGYFLKADVEKFFHTVDHAILLELLGRKIADRRTLALCAEILASSQDSRFRSYFPGDDLFALQRPTGIPIGNLTSQLFANVYLGELDRFVKQDLRWKAYLRYMDDVVLFAESKPELWEALSRIERFLAERLRLRLHPEKRVVSPVRCGVDWVGYRVYPDRVRRPGRSPAAPHALGKCVGVTVRLRRRNIFRFRARCARMRAAMRRGRIGWPKVQESIRSFLGYALWADSRRLMERILWLEVF